MKRLLIFLLVSALCYTVFADDDDDDDEGAIATTLMCVANPECRVGKVTDLLDGLVDKIVEAVCEDCSFIRRRLLTRILGKVFDLVKGLLGASD